MAYIRKTRDEYVIMANYGYGHGFEEVDAEGTYKEAKQLLKEYRANERGITFELRCKRVPIVKEV